MKKNKTTLNYEEGKELFNKFNLDTLDSIDLLYDITKEESPTAFSVVYDKKYNFEVANGNFEGMNEYTYGTKLDNFNITEIIIKLPELDKKEIKYIMKLINKTINTINPDQEEMKIIPKLAEFIKAYASFKQIQMEVLPCGMSREELEHFFKKYNFAELNEFNTIIGYTDLEDKEEIKKIKEKIDKEKVAPTDWLYESASKKPLKLPDLQRKNYRLTNKELKFFHVLVESAAGYLESLRDFEEEYQAIYEDFTSDCFPIDQMAELLDAIELEQDIRSGIKTRRK